MDNGVSELQSFYKDFVMYSADCLLVKRQLIKFTEFIKVCCQKSKLLNLRKIYQMKVLVEN